MEDTDEDSSSPDLGQSGNLSMSSSDYDDDEDDYSEIALLIKEFQDGVVASEENEEDIIPTSSSSPLESERDREREAEEEVRALRSSPSVEFMTGLNSERTSTPLPPPPPPPLSSAEGGSATGELGEYQFATLRHQVLEKLKKRFKPPPSELWEMPGKMDFLAKMIESNQVDYPHWIDNSVFKDPDEIAGIGRLTPEIIHDCIHNLRMMQDFLFRAEDMELENRRRLIYRAFDLEHLFFSYLFYKVKPISTSTQDQTRWSTGDQEEEDQVGGGDGGGAEGPLTADPPDPQSESEPEGESESGIVDSAQASASSSPGPTPQSNETGTAEEPPKDIKLSKTLWTGTLPKSHLDESTLYSCKVFLGGLPNDISDFALAHFFSPFGRVGIERTPGARDRMCFAYVIFECQEQVHHLLSRCGRNVHDENKWFITMSSESIRNKRVEVVPWSLANNKFQVSPIPPDFEEDGKCFTVFVGALHGTINAEGLAHILQELFGGVLRTRIDTDRLQYPIGSAQVVFHNPLSYFAAVSAQFLDILTNKCHKVLQVEPYLAEVNPCSDCHTPDGPLFCRDIDCFQNYCYNCFLKRHDKSPGNSHQPPLFRKFSAGYQQNRATIGPPPGLTPQIPHHQPSIPASHRSTSCPPPGLTPPFPRYRGSPGPFQNGNGGTTHQIGLWNGNGNGVDGTFHPSPQLHSNGTSPSGHGSGSHLSPGGVDGGHSRMRQRNNGGMGRGLGGWIRGNRGFRHTNSIRPTHRH